MDLFLVQHGEAKPKAEDPDRSLTDAGAEATRRMAGWAAGSGLRVDRIEHSGKQRAEQTAEILAEGLKPGKGAIAVPGLKPNDDVHPVAETLKAEVVLVAVGRRPHTGGLGLAEIGVETDAHGFVKVESGFRTNVAGVFAIGDVIGGAMLAHKAEEEGVAVAEILAGQAGHVNYEAIPGVVYTWPEVASLGRTEEQLTEAGVQYRVGKFPFTANSRARCNADTDGFVKILADAGTDRVLGVHIVGPQAGDLIQEMVIAMEFGGSAEDIARSSHGHPGMSEAVKEAAMAVGGRAIHI